MAQKNFKFGENNSLSIKSATVKRITLLAYLIATAANTAFSGTPCDASQIGVKIELIRDGQKTPIFQGYLERAHALTNFSGDNFKYYKGTSWNVVLAAASGVKEQAVIPFSIDLGCIDLQGDDELIITWNIPTGAANSQVDTATSILYADIEQGEGVEYATPIIEEISIQASQTTQNFPLGDKVQSVLLFNSNKDGILSADSPWSTVTVSSNKRQTNFNYFELLGQRTSQFQYENTAALDQNFCVVPEDNTFEDNTNVNVSFNSANVTASKCFVVVKRFISSAYLQDRAARKLAQINYSSRV
jgi:hypothetical protein